MLATRHGSTRDLGIVVVMARVLAAALGLLLLIGAGRLARRETLAAPAWLQAWQEAWQEAHPDPRPLEEAGARDLDHMLARARRDDGLLLLLGLSVASLAFALWSSRRRRGPVGLAMPWAAGVLAVGLFAAVLSATEQVRRVGEGRWTLGDDALRAIAGPHAATLRKWREAIPEDDLVIVVGTQAWLFNLVAWVLFPRPIRLVGLPVPAGTSAAELAEQARALPPGASGPGRWLVDLEALAAGEGATRPALQRLRP